VGRKPSGPPPNPVFFDPHAKKNLRGPGKTLSPPPNHDFRLKNFRGA